MSISKGSRYAVFTLLGLATLLPAGERTKFQIKSSIDGTSQPCYVILPDGYRPQKAVPLVVSLHSWSAGVEQRNKSFEAQANRRGWIYLFPHFRGPNSRPEACGSEKAQRDILDALAWAKKKYKVDPQRVYLTGSSGGGHMTMLMVGRYPKVFTAASAWVGISDLAAWHKKHKDTGYGKMMRASCGGAPGESKKVDEQYRLRSPLTYLGRATSVPLDIAAGIQDGHKGSVPIRHSLEAFNAIARAAKSREISEEEMQQLSTPKGRLKKPMRSDQVADGSLGRAIYLRRYGGAARVTIFEGGHEGIAKAAFVWLDRHRSLPSSR